MADITNPRLLYFKGAALLILGLLAGGLLLAAHPSLRTAALLLIAIWAFCRAYYFVFYVIQHYIDSSYRFAGLLSFFRYLRQHHQCVQKPTETPPMDR